MRIKAEMWDKMQHIMQHYNDHMIHVYTEFDSELNIELLKKALSIVLGKIPVLRSRFVSNFVAANWETIDGFDVEDIFDYKETKLNPTRSLEKELLSIIDEKEGAQIRVFVRRFDGRDYMGILLNHMCIDGCDTKCLMSLITDSYSDLKRGGSGEVTCKSGSRSAMQIYRSLSKEQYDEAMSLISYSKKQKSKIAYPFETKNRKKIYPQINKLKISKELFETVKGKAKSMGVSINDVVLACFYRATLKFVTVKEGEALGIPNMVDLRRYMKDGKSEGMCNLTSMVVSNLGADIGENIEDTVKKAKANMDELKAYYPGLHGLPLLKKVFDLTPYGLAYFLIGTFFKNPLIGVSNIGVIDSAKYVFEGAKVKDAYITGSVKFPPYMQLALSTFNGEITNTVAVYGTEADHKMFGDMLSAFDAEMRAFAEV